MNGILSTEELLNYNWNVYKVFKNGKRAKAPLTEFEAAEDNHLEYFENEVKKNFNGSLKWSMYEVIRSDLPQERAAEQIDEEQEKFSKEKIRALGAMVKRAGITHTRPMSTALVYYAESDWKWQWAALESGTSKYVQGLSPKFSKYSEAQEWIETIVSSTP
jgi:hypothetical protein